MREELMLLGFISLLLTATSTIIANICIPSKFYNLRFALCSEDEVDEQKEDGNSNKRKLCTKYVLNHPFRRILQSLNQKSCKEGYEPFVSYEGLEQLHRFIFVMALTHISYSCLTMLLAIVKVHSWRSWEDEAHVDRHDAFSELAKATMLRRQSTFVKAHTSIFFVKNSSLIWVVSETFSLCISLSPKHFTLSRNRLGIADDSTVHTVTDTNTVMSFEEHDNHDESINNVLGTEIELQVAANGTSSRVGTQLLRHSGDVTSMPTRRDLHIR